MTACAERTNAHDANSLTFHRFEGFRDPTPADSIVNPETIRSRAAGQD
jgi:hypothetical protein